MANFPGTLLRVRWYIIYNIRGDAKVTMIYISENRKRKKSASVENKRFPRLDVSRGRQSKNALSVLPSRNRCRYRGTRPSVKDISCCFRVLACPVLDLNYAVLSPCIYIYIFRTWTRDAVQTSGYTTITVYVRVPHSCNIDNDVAALRIDLWDFRRHGCVVRICRQQTRVE